MGESGQVKYLGVRNFEFGLTICTQVTKSLRIHSEDDPQRLSVEGVHRRKPLLALS